MARPTGKLVPATGCMLGAFTLFDPDWVNLDKAKQDVLARERQLGRKYRIDMHFQSWDSPWPWPTDFEVWDRDNGRIPLITWDGLSMDQVVNGSQDTIIRDRARRSKAFGVPFFVRLWSEMNGEWAAFNAGRYGNDPSKYVAGWRRVVDIFRAEGASNVVWVWAPNCTDIPAADWNHWTRYYPGDDYVDWVGIDGYNWGGGQPGPPWQSFADIMTPLYNDYAARKPIMISETGSSECQGGVGQCKSRWIYDMRMWIRRKPAIAALVWFDIRKERDWRPDSSTAALKTFQSLAKDPYFQA